MVEEAGSGSLTAEPSTATSRRVWFLALLTAVLVSTLIRLRGPLDIDTWLHLRVGDALRSGVRFGVVPDPLVVIADRPYVATQWLSQVIFSAVYEIAGLNGILMLRLAALLVLLAALFLASRRSAGPVAAALATLIGMAASSAAWAERPQVFGLALQGVLVLLWLKALRTRTIPWLVIPLLWVWACLHGTWIVGLATGLLITAGVAMESRVEAKRIYGLVVVNVASVLAVALTPIGPRLLVEPFNVGELATALAPEWQRPNWHNPLMLLVLAMVLVIAVRMVRTRTLCWHHVMMAAGGFALSVYTVRTIAFGAVLVAPAFAAALSYRHGTSRISAMRLEAAPWLVSAAVIVLMPGAIVGFPREPPVGPAISSRLNTFPAGTHVAVDLRVSGWFLHAHPSLKPLRDVRAEIYSPQVAAAFQSFDNAGPRWQEYVQRHNVRAILVAPDSALHRALAGGSKWKEIATQDDYSLWVPANSAELQGS